jgi:hypothetical protein
VAWWPSYRLCGGGRAATLAALDPGIQASAIPPQGMLAADRELTEHFHYGPGIYQSLFLPGPHRFDIEVQNAVKSFFANNLLSPPGASPTVKK